MLESEVITQKVLIFFMKMLKRSQVFLMFIKRHLRGTQPLLNDRTSVKPAQGLDAVILLECLLWALPNTSTSRSFGGSRRTCVDGLSGWSTPKTSC